MTDTHTQPLLLDGQGCKPIHPLRNNIPYIFQITAVQCTSEPGDQLYNGQQDILVQPGFSFVPPLNRERELGMITLAVTCSHHHCHCCQPPEIFSQENLHTVLFLHTFLVAQQLKANKLNFIKPSALSKPNSTKIARHPVHSPYVGGEYSLTRSTISSKRVLSYLKGNGSKRVLSY